MTIRILQDNTRIMYCAGNRKIRHKRVQLGLSRTIKDGKIVFVAECPYCKQVYQSNLAVPVQP